DMFEGKRVGGVVLIGGEGKRFGGEVPKQFLELAGKKVYLHVVEAFLKTGLFDEVVLVCHPDWIGEVEGKVVAGGVTRQGSSRKGIEALAGMDVVVIHDGVRPFVDGRILRENVEGAVRWGAVDTCVPSADTLVYAPGGVRIEAIPRRGDYLRGQTPQSFRREWILEAHERAERDGIVNATDDCQLVLRMGREVRVVRGDERNLKITTEFDFLLAKQINDRARDSVAVR
ncbi:MAG TPA: IspD/TarI family cytidylyltransferase, partial [Chlamydiales bacterium]|nr:IspD/TarI family cytidylyltransferase [Chlamydiales bacterium]